jgi:hypothetical protein
MTGVSQAYIRLPAHTTGLSVAHDRVVYSNVLMSAHMTGLSIEHNRVVYRNVFMSAHTTGLSIAMYLCPHT